MRDPLRPGDVLGDLLKDVGSKAKRSRFVSALEGAVGPELFQHLQVLGFRGGRLWVEVDSAPLHAELVGFRSEEIRTACNDRLDGDQIAEIVFRQAGTGHA